MEANTFCWKRLESKTVVATMRKTTNTAAVISALATASYIGAGTWQSHWVLQSVVLGGFHELVWCIAEMRRVAPAHVVGMSLSRVMVHGFGWNSGVQVVVHGGNGVVQRRWSGIRGIWRVSVFLFTIKTYYKTHLLNVLSRRIVEWMRGAPQALATIAAMTYMLRTFSSGRRI